MKITINGSIAFYDQMLEVKSQLEKQGHEVKLPPSKILDGEGNAITSQQFYEIRKGGVVPGWVWESKNKAMKEHFSFIDWADAVLTLNYGKNNIPNYIGANTLIDMGIALYRNKKIYLLNPVPEISYKEEILSMQPIILNGDLSLIK